MRKSKITAREFDILKFRPDSLIYYIFSRFNKILEAHSDSSVQVQTGLTEIKNTVAYSPFITVDYFVSHIKDIENLQDILGSIHTSPGIQTAAGGVLNKSLIQFNRLFDLFKLRNFGTVNINYYEIQNQIDDFLDLFMAEHYKEHNFIFKSIYF